MTRALQNIPKKILIEGKRSSCTRASNNKNFSVTIGIPAYNERGRICYILQQVLSQCRCLVDELIINTSGSTDGTQEEVSSIVKKGNTCQPIKIINKTERAGKAAALNDILEACKTDIIVFMDGDVKLGKNCVRELLRLFFHANVGVVSGNVMPLNNESGGLFSHFSWIERQLHHKLCMDLVRRGKAPKVNGTFFALRRSVTNHLPRQTVSDDEYVSWCAQKKGYRVAYAPNAIVYTKDPDNYRDYIAKRRRIFTGHFFIKRTRGYSVPTTRFGEIAPELFRFLVREKKETLKVMAMLFLQCVSYILALSDTAGWKIPYRYRVESGKFSPR